MTEKKPDYKWPRFVLALILLFLVATTVWMVIEIHKVKQEQNFASPMQGQ